MSINRYRASRRDLRLDEGVYYNHLAELVANAIRTSQETR